MSYMVFALYIGNMDNRTGVGLLISDHRIFIYASSELKVSKACNKRVDKRLVYLIISRRDID